MRRDMDLIRRILIMVGDSPVPLQATVFVDDMHPFETVAYHIDLIGQAHLADTSITRMSGDVIARAEVGPLTWAGNEGSSPRLRGTRVPPRDTRMDRGIIPAHAGNTPTGQTGQRHCWDHPRACGEHWNWRTRALDAAGSSPRLRGTRRAEGGRGHEDGIIPALAGNTGIPRRLRLRTWDHPRACGEHLTDTPPHPCTRGSSPRLRGTRDCERPLCFSNLRSAL